MDESDMKKILLTLALVFAPSLAWAQCNGVFSANAVCGSLNGGPPGPANANSFAVGLHLVVYTVAPGSASAADRVRADFAGDGVNDQTAILSAITAAGASNGKVVMLPGTYTFGAQLTIPHRDYFVIEGRGTQYNCPTGSATCILEQGGVGNAYNFGYFISNSSGCALALSPAGTSGNGIAGSTFTWEAMTGVGSHIGTGLCIVNGSGTNGQGTSYFYGGGISGYNRGVSLIATGGATNIDTNVFNINYLFNNNVDVYENGSGGSNVNANTWNVNIDASWNSGAIGFESNGLYDVVNATIGGVPGANIQLDSGATNTVLNLTPQTLAVTAGSVVDNSGNTTNIVNVGMPTSFLATPVYNEITKWNGSTTGQLDHTGIAFGSGAGSQYDVLYYSAAGTIGHLTGTAGKTLMGGAPPAFSATPTLGASGTLGSLTMGNATSGLLTLQPQTGALGSVTVSLPAVTDTLASRTLLQSAATVVASLPTCNAGAQGLRYFVTDQATAIAYHGAVTGSGAFKQGVTCDGTAWYQD
jgi:hypothetical protein